MSEQTSQSIPGRRWWERQTPAWAWVACLGFGFFFLVNAPDGMSWGSWTVLVVLAVAIGFVFGRWHRQAVLARLGVGSSVVWVRWGRAARDDSQTPPQVLPPKSPPAP